MPTRWNDGENVIWKTEIPGAGASSPVIYRNHLFLIYFTGYGVDQRNPGNINDLKRHILCIEIVRGDVLWKRQVKTILPEKKTPRFLCYTSSTPVADTERIYCIFGKSGVIAFDHIGQQLPHGE